MPLLRNARQIKNRVDSPKFVDRGYVAPLLDLVPRRGVGCGRVRQHLSRYAAEITQLSLFVLVALRIRGPACLLLLRDEEMTAPNANNCEPRLKP